MATWDNYKASEPHDSDRWAASDRGWLFRGQGADAACYGHYLDYGPNHYRSPHEYCQTGQCQCRAFQPGNIHAVRFDRVNGTTTRHEARYFPTVEQAQRWIEQGPGA